MVWVAVKVRFPRELLVGVDRVRGVVPREVWVRGVCGDAVVAGGVLGGGGVVDVSVPRSFSEGQREEVALLGGGDVVRGRRW